MAISPLWSLLGLSSCLLVSFKDYPDPKFPARLTCLFVIVLGVMFSIARSRYTIPTQVAFLATNAAGIVLGLFYNANTPDLYPNNAHHKLGWLVSWVASAQVTIGLAGRASSALSCYLRNRRSNSQSREEQAFIPVSSGAIAAHERLYASPYQHSQSHAGASSRNDSVSTMVGQESPSGPSFEQARHFDNDMDNDEHDDDLELKPSDHWRASVANESILARVSRRISAHAWGMLEFVYNFIDRTILIVGSITIATGIITYARFFVSAAASSYGGDLC